MEAINLFSAGVRILGLLSAGRGIGDLLYATLVSLNLTTRSVTDTTVSYTEFVYGIFYLLVGLYLLRGAPWVMDFAFPVDTTSELDKDYDLDDQQEHN
ncbi:MAG: hypothetical protein ACRD43_04005 [Pyrinomonadaceae bacterium]